MIYSHSVYPWGRGLGVTQGRNALQQPYCSTASVVVSVTDARYILFCTPDSTLKQAKWQHAAPWQPPHRGETRCTRGMPATWSRCPAVVTRRKKCSRFCVPLRAFVVDFFLLLSFSISSTLWNFSFRMQFQTYRKARRARSREKNT